MCWFRFWSRPQVSTFRSSMWCHSFPTPDDSLSSQDPSWISPCDSSLLVSQSGAYYCSHMCYQRARSDPPAQSNHALPFSQYEIAEMVSLQPEHLAISSCFKKGEETVNTPASERGRWASNPPCNNKHEENSFSHCPKMWKPLVPENLFCDHLGQKEDSANWKTEREKLDKEEGNVFTPRINDARQSPASVTWLGSRHRSENANNAVVHTNFDLGDPAINIDSTRIHTINAENEIEWSSEEMMGKGHLYSALPLVEKHGADSGESFVQNNNSADGGKDESVIPPEDTNQFQHIGECVRVYRILCFNLSQLTCWIFSTRSAIQVLFVGRCNANCNAVIFLLTSIVLL